MVKFLRHIIQGHKRDVVSITLIGIIDVALSLLFVWYSKMIIDVATGAAQGSLMQYTIYLIVILLVQILLQIADVRLRNMAQVRLGNSIRHKIFSHLLYIRWQELSSLHSGDVLTRVIKDTDEVVSTLISSIPQAISATIQFIGALIFLYILDPTLAILLGTIMPLIAIFSKMYYKKMRQYSLEIKESESSITSLMEESLLNQVVIRTFERQEEELGRMSRLQSQLRGRVQKRTNVSVFANTLMRTAFSGGYLAAFIWSAFQLAKKAISFGTVTAYLQLVARIQRPLFDLIRLFPTFISAKAASERLIFLTDFETEDTGEKIFLDGKVTLQAENISFAYEDEVPILSDFSFVASPGKMIAVMGETGAGKTTLLRLLLALVKPVKGRLLLKGNGREVEISEKTRSNFVYVPQGGSLFSGTIRENLLIGNPQADDATLNNALKTASANFVFDLPQGLDTTIGEKGARLSEGQAQRVAIARSLLRPGKILLLDEATSALDVATEKSFLTNLKKEMGDRVVLFITHHPEVAKFCDEIIYL